MAEASTFVGAVSFSACNDWPRILTFTRSWHSTIFSAHGTSRKRSDAAPPSFPSLVKPRRSSPVRCRVRPVGLFRILSLQPVYRKLTAVTYRRRTISRHERQAWLGRLAVAVYRLRSHQCVPIAPCLRFAPSHKRLTLEQTAQRSLSVSPASSCCPTLRPRRRLAFSRLKNEPTPLHASAPIRSRASLIGPYSVESLRGGTSTCSRSFGECFCALAATRTFAQD